MGYFHESPEEAFARAGSEAAGAISLPFYATMPWTASGSAATDAATEQTADLAVDLTPVSPEPEVVPQSAATPAAASGSSAPTGGPVAGSPAKSNVGWILGAGMVALLLLRR